jgi:PAS domain S-box-containing protein
VRELSTAVEQGPAGIAIVDVAGCLVYSNVMFLRITGLAEAAGTAAMADVLPAEVWQRLAAAAQGGRTDPEEVFARRQPQGPFWGLISVAGIRSPAGSTGHLVVALQDITHEKAEQQEREALLQRLQQAGKMEAIGRLAGGIAHDFNNLLGAMMGFAQFLVEDLEEGSDSRHHAERIARMCDKGRDMVEQLLAFARAREPGRQVLDLAVELQHCRDLLDASLPSSSKLVIAPGEEPLPVFANKSQLQQIMLNLCLNARDALDGVPGTITARLTRVRPDAALDGMPDYFSVGQTEADRDYALLSVSDTGAGMDSAIKAKIFEPFFTTKGLSRGTGLGLAVVHGIVTSHGGAIHVESAPGTGTTFEVYLPIEPAMPEKATATPCAPNAVHGYERILVVDDDPDLVQAFTIGLNRYGYEVLSLSDPLKALKLFNDLPERWDLVISDQVMPGMAGLELIAAMKQRQPGLRAILYTGFDEGITEAAAVQQGVDVLLHKPLSPQTLALHIRKAMADRT